MGISARERRVPLKTRGQEVTGQDSPQRVFVIDSDQRRQYEQAKRAQAMERTRLRLAKLQQRVADGKVTDPEQLGAAASRALQAHHGYRYYRWELRAGTFHYEEDPVRLPQEQRLEGRYVIATGERGISLLEAVAWYKQLIEVERSFRLLKDVLALRPIYHRVAPRVRGHIFVAALAPSVQRLLERRLDGAGIELSATQSLQAVETIRLVNFKVDKKRRRGVSTPSGRAGQVLKAVSITATAPPTPPSGPTEVM
jgi:transposase